MNLRPQHPNDMNREEYEEWVQHPELSDWVNIKPRRRSMGVAPQSVVDSSKQYISLATVLGIVSLLLSLVGPPVTTFSICLGMLGIILAIRGLLVSVVHFKWLYEQLSRAKFIVKGE